MCCRCGPQAAAAANIVLTGTAVHRLIRMLEFASTRPSKSSSETMMEPKPWFS